MDRSCKGESRSQITMRLGFSICYARSSFPCFLAPGSALLAEAESNVNGCSGQPLIHFPWQLKSFITPLCDGHGALGA